MKLVEQTSRLFYVDWPGRHPSWSNHQDWPESRKCILSLSLTRTKPTHLDRMLRWICDLWPYKMRCPRVQWRMICSQKSWGFEWRVILTRLRAWIFWTGFTGWWWPSIHLESCHTSLVKLTRSWQLWRGRVCFFAQITLQTLSRRHPCLLLW